MALVCAISNETPEIPVISTVSGCVFERRLIEKYLAENGGIDPINGHPMTVDELVEIKTPPFVKAKPPTYTSIPGILKALQDEWDAVMLHSFTLRQQLQTARQELSHALYQHDAACRVIARLSKEVSAAREALATLKPQHAPNVGFTAQPVIIEGNTAPAPATEVVGISEEVQQILQDTASSLTQDRKRKGKTVPQNLATPETIKDFRVVKVLTGLHSASNPGILCLDVLNNLMVTGGNDKCVSVSNQETEQAVCSLRGHAKKVTHAIWHKQGDLVVSGSQDSTVRVWNVKSAQNVQTFHYHDAPICGVSFHPTGDYLLTASLDRHWVFSSLTTGSVMAKVLGDEESDLTSAQFHPDGLIFATGTSNSAVKIWELKGQCNVANFAGHSGKVTSIAFSENGYYLATAAEDSTVKLWDLRKLKNFKTINTSEGFVIKDLTFDETGSYMGMIGTEMRIYGCKTWNEIATFNEHQSDGTGVRFGSNASFIASTSLDRTLKIYSLS